MQLLPFVLMLGVLYAVMIVPQRKKQKATQSMLASVGPGDEVLTAGGIYGGVTEVDGDDVYIEIAPDIEVKVTKRSVTAVVYQAGSAKGTTSGSKKTAPAIPEPYEAPDDEASDQAGKQNKS